MRKAVRRHFVRRLAGLVGVSFTLAGCFVFGPSMSLNFTVIDDSLLGQLEDDRAEVSGNREGFTVTGFIYRANICSTVEFESERSGFDVVLELTTVSAGDDPCVAIGGVTHYKIRAADAEPGTYHVTVRHFRSRRVEPVEYLLQITVR